MDELPFIQSIPHMTDTELHALVGRLREMRARAVDAARKTIKARSETKVKLTRDQKEIEDILTRIPEEQRELARRALTST